MTPTFGFDIGLLAAAHLVVQNISSCDLRSACLPPPYPTSWGPVRAMKTLISHFLNIIISASPLPPSSMLNQLGVGSACDEHAHFCKCCARPHPSTLNWGGQGGGDDNGSARTDERFYRTHRKDLFVVQHVCRVNITHSFNNYLMFHSAWLRT